MKSFDYYKEKLQAINQALDDHLGAVLEDGVIDYEEAVETRGLTAEFARQLQALKKELNLDIREIRAGFQLQITNAARGEKAPLRRQKVNALAPYEYIKLRIDKILLNIANVKDASPDASLAMIEELDTLARATLESPVVALAEAAAAGDDDDDVVGLDEIKILETRWRALLQSVEAALAGGRASAKHHMRLKTAEHVLNIVLEDIGHVIGE